MTNVLIQYKHTLIYTLYHFLYLINDVSNQTVTLTLAISVSKRAITLNEDRFIYAKYGNKKAEGGKL